jgi:hypothetical protein
MKMCSLSALHTPSILHGVMVGADLTLAVSHALNKAKSRSSSQSKMACTVCFGSTAFMWSENGFSTVHCQKIQWSPQGSVWPFIGLPFLIVRSIPLMWQQVIGQELLNYIMYFIAFWHLKTSISPFRTFQVVGWLNLITSRFCFPFFYIENLTGPPPPPPQNKEN